MDVFFYEAFEEEEKELRRLLPQWVNAGFSWKTIQEEAHAEPPAKVISTRTQSAFPAAWKTRLSGIVSRSTGYDHLVDFLDGTKIKGGFLPLYCNRAVAEHAMMLWMALLRKLPQQRENFKKFLRDGLTGREVDGKTLVVVGVGNIGGQVVKIGHGLGMNVICVDLIIKYPEEFYLPVEDAITRADIIVCAMNLTAENRGYFTYELLKKAPRGAIFINVSRGELASSEAILNLLEENHLAGAGIDVFNEEKELAVSLRSGKISENPEVKAALALYNHPRVLLTPHNAFNTAEAVERKSSQTIEQLVYFLQNGEFIWPIPHGNYQH